MENIGRRTRGHLKHKLLIGSAIVGAAALSSVSGESVARPASVDTVSVEGERALLRARVERVRVALAIQAGATVKRQVGGQEIAQWYNWGNWPNGWNNYWGN